MAKASISVCKGKGSLNHNNREFVTENVDPNRTPDNITYKRETLEQAYEKCFGQAVEEYNAKQKRADRRIDGAKGYMEQIRNSKNGEKLFYENVVQVGNMFDSHVGTAQGEVCKEILDDYMRDFQKRNPNLYVFNAVLHMDEQTPHLHIDYIPLAHGYKQGLSVRNSLDRAFGEQGIEGKSNKYENRTIAWQNREKDHIESIMKEYHLERAQDKGLDQEHLTVDQYKAVAERIHAEVKQIPKQIETAPMMLNKERVTVKKTDLEQLEQRAKLSLVHEKATKQLVAEVKKDAKETHQYNVDKMSRALMYQQGAENLFDRANEEKKKAEKLRQKAEKMVKAQEELNDRYKRLYNAYTEQKQTIESLQTENTSLKRQNADLRATIEERVQKAVEPLQKQIQGFKERIADLQERLDGMCQSLTNVTKAFGMLKHDKEDGYQVHLNEKQSRLFTAIEKYTTKWLREENKEDMAVDVEKHIGISKGISKEIEALTPKRTQNQDRGR